MLRRKDCLTKLAKSRLGPRQFPVPQVKIRAANVCPVDLKERTYTTGADPFVTVMACHL